MAEKSESSKRGRTWEHEETVVLIEKWGEDNIQERLKQCTRKKPIWKEISDFIRASGYEDRDENSCKTRIRNLVNAYRAYKDGSSKTGNAPPKKPPFLEELEPILSDKPSTRPLVLLSSTVVVAEPAGKPETTGDEAPEGDHGLLEIHGAAIPEDPAEDVEVEDIPILEKATKRRHGEEKKPAGQQKRPRMTQKDVLSKVDDALGAFLTYQQEADKRFEEKEKERETREEEREEKRRREDQEFLLRLAKVLKD